MAPGKVSNLDKDRYKVSNSQKSFVNENVSSNRTAYNDSVENDKHKEQLIALRSEVEELKHLVKILVGKEALAQREKASLDILSSDKLRDSAVIRKNPFDSIDRIETVSNGLLSGGSSSLFKDASTTPADNKKEAPAKPEDPEQKTVKERERMRIAIDELTLGQMKVKLEEMEFQNFLLKDKAPYERKLALLQHQSKLFEMTNAAFAKIRADNEAMWLSIKQQEDQLDKMRIKVLGGG